MSDNISADEVKRRLVIFLRIPAEVWTDVLKLLPRRVLVQNIAPACYRLKEISDKNVKNIHVIDNWSRRMAWDPFDATTQLEHLAGNKCQLASQFRLTELSIRDVKSQPILRHCPDLFNGCHIKLDFDRKNKDSTLFLECLTHLEMAKPIRICVHQDPDQVIDFWHHPTFQHCTRVDLFFWLRLSTATSATTFENIFDWLHHNRQSTDEMDCDGAGNVDQQVRCMIVRLEIDGHERIDWLINRCSEDLQQSHGPADRRPFVLSFNINRWDWDWPGFDQFHRAENKSTGEVLALDRLMNASGHPFYRLRRCLAEEEANGAEFYAGMFKPNVIGNEEFNTGDDNISPSVRIWIR